MRAARGFLEGAGIASGAEAPSCGSLRMARLKPCPFESSVADAVGVAGLSAASAKDADSGRDDRFVSGSDAGSELDGSSELSFVVRLRKRFSPKPSPS